MLNALRSGCARARSVCRCTQPAADWRLRRPSIFATSSAPTKNATDARARTANAALERVLLNPGERDLLDRYTQAARDNAKVLQRSINGSSETASLLKHQAGKEGSLLTEVLKHGAGHAEIAARMNEMQRPWRNTRARANAPARLLGVRETELRV